MRGIRKKLLKPRTQEVSKLTGDRESFSLVIQTASGVIQTDFIGISPWLKLYYNLMYLCSIFYDALSNFNQKYRNICSHY